jgi:hypothetical protein
MKSLIKGYGREKIHWPIAFGVVVERFVDM